MPLFTSRTPSQVKCANFTLCEPLYARHTMRATLTPFLRTPFLRVVSIQARQRKYRPLSIQYRLRLIVQDSVSDIHQTNFPPATSYSRTLEKYSNREI